LRAVSEALQQEEAQDLKSIAPIPKRVRIWLGMPRIESDETFQALAYPYADSLVAGDDGFTTAVSLGLGSQVHHGDGARNSTASGEDCQLLSNSEEGVECIPTGACAVPAFSSSFGRVMKNLIFGHENEWKGYENPFKAVERLQKEHKLVNLLSFWKATYYLALFFNGQEPFKSFQHELGRRWFQEHFGEAWAYMACDEDSTSRTQLSKEPSFHQRLCKEWNLFVMTMWTEHNRWDKVHQFLSTSADA